MRSTAEYAAFLTSWEGVPYRDGGCTQQGVDCIRFAVIVLDWLHGLTGGAEACPKLPKQTSLHNPQGAESVVSWLSARYLNNRRVGVCCGDQTYISKDLEAGSCAVLSCDSGWSQSKTPNHILVAGAEPYTLWHCVNGDSLPHGGCVQKTSVGWAAQNGLRLLWIPYRPLLHP